MGFNITLFLSFFLPQLIIVGYFNNLNIKNTGLNKGSRNTANATHGFCFAVLISLCIPFILLHEYTLGGTNTRSTDVMIHMCMSFFACHGVFVLKSDKIQYSEFFHHLICLIGLGYSLLTQTFGQDILLALFLGEVTFTFYGKIIAQNMNWAKIEKLCNEIFFVLFSFIRMIVFPIYLYFFLTGLEVSLFVQVLASIFVFLGIYWSIILMKNRIKHHRPLAVYQSIKRLVLNQKHFFS